MNLKEVLTKCENTGAWYGVRIERLDQRNFLGDTPLHTVCSWGEAEPVKCLIREGADVNAKGDQGATPLFNAMIGNNLEVIRLLIEAGADLNARNVLGADVAKYARIAEVSEEIIELISSKR